MRFLKPYLLIAVIVFALSLASEILTFKSVITKFFILRVCYNNETLIVI